MIYVVFGDLETWSTEGYVIPAEILTDEQSALVDEGDSKVFKTEDIPGIAIHEMIAMLREAGLWQGIVENLQKEAQLWRRER